MRIVIMLLLALAAVMPARAQYFFTDTATLNTAYRELMKEPENESRQLAFLNAYPRTWLEFVNLYIVPLGPGRPERESAPIAFRAGGHGAWWPGFDNAMHKAAEAHASALIANTDNIKAGDMLCDKLVNIFVVLPYDCDVSGTIQSGVRRQMKIRRDQMFNTVVNLTEPDQLRFWLNYCASITDNETLKQELDELYEAFKAKYPEEARTMKIGYDYAFDKSVFDDDGYGHIDRRKSQPNLWPAP